MREIPRSTRIRVVPVIGDDPTIQGRYSSERREILLKEGRVTGRVLGHELGHRALRHGGNPTSAEGFVGGEIDAYVWSYSRSRQPVHMKATLRAIINTGMWTFDASPMQMWRILDRKLKKTRGVPKTWVQDLRSLRREARAAEEPR